MTQSGEEQPGIVEQVISQAVDRVAETQVQVARSIASLRLVQVLVVVSFMILLQIFTFLAILQTRTNVTENSRAVDCLIATQADPTTVGKPFGLFECLSPDAVIPSRQ